MITQWIRWTQVRSCTAAAAESTESESEQISGGARCVIGSPAVKPGAAFLEMGSDSPKSKLGAVPQKGGPVESVNQPKPSGQSDLIGSFRCG